MNIAEAIQEIYPNLRPAPLGTDYAVSQDAQGNQYVSEWNNPNPRPTQQQLADGWFRVSQKRIRRDYAAAYLDERGALYAAEAQGNPEAEEACANMTIMSNELSLRAGATRDLYARWGRAQKGVDAAKTLADLQALPGWSRIQAVDEVGVSAAVKPVKPSQRDENQDRQLKALRQELAAERNKNITQQDHIQNLYRMLDGAFEAIEGRVRQV